MAVKQLEDLEVWQEARRLTQIVYRVTTAEKFSKDFSLRDQIQKAAVSVMSNIAEGFERGGNQEFIQFLYVAKAILWRSAFANLRRTRSSLCRQTRFRRIDRRFQASVRHDRQLDQLPAAQRYERSQI